MPGYAAHDVELSNRFGGNEVRSHVLPDRLERLEKATCVMMECVERLQASLSPILTPSMPRNGDKPQVNAVAQDSPMAVQLGGIECRLNDACAQIRDILEHIQL